MLSWKEKQHNIGFPAFKYTKNTKKYFRTDLFNIIFDDFGI